MELFSTFQCYSLCASTVNQSLYNKAPKLTSELCWQDNSITVNRLYGDKHNSSYASKYTDRGSLGKEERSKLGSNTNNGHKPKTHSVTFKEFVFGRPKRSLWGISRMVSGNLNWLHFIFKGSALGEIIPCSFTVVSQYHSVLWDMCCSR